ncbi:type II toxin-antitoxin system VapC family toxin [Saccharothrix hoggarensis]|uniref:Ribonuclease VapC n=1 Tax=Saccharothrix hoggarensis TaxID=913853 RepID=A0ABW3R0S0_9PSEU
MATVVIDASALIEAMIGAEPVQPLRRRVLASELAAPDLIICEVLNVLRRRARVDAVGRAQANRAAWWLARAPIATTGHRALIDRAWELCDSLSAYDAQYVALAEQLDVPLITCDAKLAGSHGHKVDIEVYPVS